MSCGTRCRYFFSKLVFVGFQYRPLVNTTVDTLPRASLRTCVRVERCHGTVACASSLGNYELWTWWPSPPHAQNIDVTMAATDLQPVSCVQMDNAEFRARSMRALVCRYTATQLQRRRQSCRKHNPLYRYSLPIPLNALLSDRRRGSLTAHQRRALSSIPAGRRRCRTTGVSVRSVGSPSIRTITSGFTTGRGR